MFYCLKLFLVKYFTTIFIFLEHLEDWQKPQNQGTLENCVCLKIISKLRDVFSFEVHNPAKPYSSLKILLGSQDNFYIILSSYVERHLKKKKKKSGLNFMSLIAFHVSKIWRLYGKFTVQQVLKSFASRNNSLESLAVGFSNSHPCGME